MFGVSLISMASWILSTMVPPPSPRPGPPPSPPGNRMDRLGRLFDRWDLNGNGVLDRGEFGAGMRRFAHARHAGHGGGRGSASPRLPDAEGGPGPFRGPPPSQGGCDRNGGELPRRGQRVPPNPARPGGRGRGDGPPPFQQHGDRPPPERRPATPGAKFLERFDENRDGVVTREEFPGDPRRFDRLDANGDGQIDRREIQQAVSRRGMAGRREPSRDAAMQEGKAPPNP